MVLSESVECEQKYVEEMTRSVTMCYYGGAVLLVKNLVTAVQFEVTFNQLSLNDGSPIQFAMVTFQPNITYFKLQAT